MNDQRYRRVEKEIYTNVRHNETRPDNTLGLYHPDMGHFGASPTANNRGYVALVQVISAVGEYHCLQSMPPSTDTQLLNATDYQLHLCQPVLSPRYILKRWCRHYRVRGSLPTSLFIWYLCPPFECCRGDVGLFTIREKSYPISNECSITDNLAYVSLAFLTFKTLTGAFWIETWGHYWSWPPQGDLRNHRLACLSGLYPLPTNAHTPAAKRIMDSDYSLCTASKVLEGYQLSVICTRYQYSYV